MQYEVNRSRDLEAEVCARHQHNVTRAGEAGCVRFMDGCLVVERSS